MHRKSWPRVLPIVVLAAAGCATVNPVADYDRARDYAGATAAVEPGLVAGLGDDSEVAGRVAHLLQGGVSTEEAVEIALLNNNGLQAAFYEIGISRADVVQAGQLSNPSLGAVLRFPRDGGDPTIEARFALNLIELWHRPARKRVEQRRLERTVLQVAHDAAALVARTKAAYIGALAAQEARTVEEDNFSSTEEFLQLTLARQEAGAATEVEVNAARAEHLEQEVRLRSAKLSELEAKLRLATLFGLDLGTEELVLTSPLSPPRATRLDLETLMASALSHRLDLWAAKQSVQAFEAAVSMERRLFFRRVEGGVELEGRGDELEIGPGIDIDVPLFDQNRAQVSKASLRHEQATAALDALTVSARQQVRTAYERVVSTLETARAYREQIAPLRESSLQLARESFLAGKSGFLSVLEAQKEVLAARRESNSWTQRAALMLIELETACGRPLRDLVETPEPQTP